MQINAMIEPTIVDYSFYERVNNLLAEFNANIIDNPMCIKTSSKQRLPPKIIIIKVFGANI